MTGPLTAHPMSKRSKTHLLFMHAGLRWASNMGHLDVFPETSGKAQVAKYLLKRLDGEASSSFLLCDDANDMGAHSGTWSGILKAVSFFIPPSSSRVQIGN